MRVPVAMAGERIGLLGGSFNPAHDGHRRLALYALKRLALDRVWWLVSPGNPLKSRADLAPLGERLEQAAAVAHHPRIVVTGFEAELGSPYTADTVRYLGARCPATRFVWLMGADNFATIHLWHDWRSIFAAMPIAVFDRPGWRHRARASPAARLFERAFLPEARAARLADAATPAWTLVTMPLSRLSSSALRGTGRKENGGRASARRRRTGAPRGSASRP